MAYPATPRALSLASEIRNYLTEKGLSDRVFTPNGDLVSISILLKAKTAYKLTLKYLTIPKGYIEGQIMINYRSKGTKTYWDLLDTLDENGFRAGITVPANGDVRVREHFTEYIDENDGERKSYRTDIISIKTKEGLTKPLETFRKFFDIIIAFEKLECAPVKAHSKLSAAAPAWVPPREPPSLASQEWVPLPRASATTKSPTSWAEEMDAEQDAKNDDSDTTDAQIARLREQLEQLEAKKAKKTADAEREKKLAEFKTKQATELAEFKTKQSAELAEFEKTLM